MGILIAAGATNNTVGGMTPAARNLISGNKGSGVQIGATSDVSAASGNVVAGNDIGTDVTGLIALGNGNGDGSGSAHNQLGDGVDLIGANSIDNTIGGSVAAAGNLIAGNAYDGIYLDGASSDTLEFNLVGADAAKNFTNTSMGNADNGIELDDAAKITISKNLVVNNLLSGIALFYPQTADDLIQQQRNHPQRRQRHPVLLVWRRRECDLWKLDRHRLVGHCQSRQQRRLASTLAARTILSVAWPLARPTSSLSTRRLASGSNN